MTNWVDDNPQSWKLDFASTAVLPINLRSNLRPCGVIAITGMILKAPLFPVLGCATKSPLAVIGGTAAIANQREYSKLKTIRAGGLP
jgi:hypothetical protein